MYDDREIGECKATAEYGRPVQEYYGAAVQGYVAGQAVQEYSSARLQEWTSSARVQQSWRQDFSSSPVKLIRNKKTKKIFFYKK